MPGIRETMTEFGEGKLHSGSKDGPKVKYRAQAIAIGLSEQRKEGHQMKDHVDQPKGHKVTKMEHMHSDLPFGAATSGAANAHHIEQGHKVSGSERKNDGAGRHGADESGHSSYSEHKEPHHPAGRHTKQGHDPVKDGAYGYPGETMHLNAGDKDHALVGGDYSQSAHEPAVLKTPDGQGFTAGHPGIHAGSGSAPSGYGHTKSQRDGVHRLSGHPNAHRLGKR
jgi:Family of unknown function (DUF6496)